MCIIGCCEQPVNRAGNGMQQTLRQEFLRGNHVLLENIEAREVLNLLQCWQPPQRCPCQLHTIFRSAVIQRFIRSDNWRRSMFPFQQADDRKQVRCGCGVKHVNVIVMPSA
eukprot:6480701-Amphidinium_carterae.1